jgi:hypothetical protein
MTDLLKEAETFLANLPAGDWLLANKDTVVRTPDGNIGLTNLSLSDEEFHAHARFIAAAPVLIRGLVEQLREKSRIHRWVKHHGDTECCTVCGVIRRHDDLNKPCRGPVHIAVRSEF